MTEEKLQLKKFVIQFTSSEIAIKMSGREDISEQPRKKQRLNGPEDASVPANAAISSTNAEVEAATSQEDATKAQLEQERKAGITVWATDAPGFAGVVKKRYTDFLVNEILLNKHVLHLEDIAKPEKKEKKPQKPKKEKKAPIEGQAQTEASAVAGASVAQPAEVKTEDVTGAAEATEKVQKLSEEDSAEARKNVAIAAIPEQDMKTLQHIFGEKSTKELCTLYGKICARPDRKARDFYTLTTDVIEDKEKRTNAHISCRRIFHGLIETMTGDNNAIHAKACPNTATNKPRKQNDVRNGPSTQPKGKVGWDELGGEYLHFTLYKENKDTMEVLYFMASQLKLAIKNFQFAGTKDRRGVTVQRVAAFRIPADRLQNLNHMLRAARMGGFQHQKHGLELGDLHGNEFTITLRDCVFPDAPTDPAARLEHAKEIADAALTNFQQTGFINYYGLQRFGSFSIGTDQIGMRMLQGDLEGAINMICSYSPTVLAAAQAAKGQATSEDFSASAKVSQDDMARAEALHIWETEGKQGPALDKMPRRFQAEVAIIRHLGMVDNRTGEYKRRRDWQGALMGIARQLRLMYVHAYQSLVWNVAAGKRWETYGKNVVEGDLVMVHEHKDKEIKEEVEPLEDVDADGEIIIRPAIEDMATKEEDRFERARVLTKEEAESGKYNIFDLVLPLPGFDVIYPPNEIGQFYKEFMGSERGGKLNPNDMRRKWKDISLSGGYRKMMARPGNVSWEVKAYSKDDEQMVQTDLEKLLGKEEAEKTRSAAASGYNKVDGTVTEDADVKMEEAPKTDEMAEVQDKIAVVLRMQLGSSQYATMALRELSKGGAITYKPDFSGAR